MMTWEKIHNSMMKTDREFFSSPTKGEDFELRAQLQDGNVDERVAAIKRILAMGTRGTSLDPLFINVLNCAHTDSIKLKKLVYFYLMNTAHRNSEASVLVVNTLFRDLTSHQPYVRAFALRAAVGMDVPAVTQQFGAQLLQSLHDEDPYVRKTAALSVARLYHAQQQWTEDLGLVDRLHELLADSNAAVLVNVIASLMEMQQLEFKEFSLVQTMMAALSESHEWGQVTILDALSKYAVKSPWEKNCITERVMPYLQHANAAVVISAIRVILLNIHLFENDQNYPVLVKINSALKTLLTTEPALQYVALRNIQIILKKYPNLMQNDIQAFFLKYNEPIYIKLEKLEIIINLANLSNISLVLSELEEYSREIDVELVRKAILAIGRCAMKLEQAANQCVHILIKLLDNNISYITEAVIIALRDIFRSFPREYEQALNGLNTDFDGIQDVEAKAALIWIIGEFADRITDADLLLEQFVDNFLFDCASVQLATLTATVKAFLMVPRLSELVQTVLTQATSVGNPDLRDRAFIYWRLLSTDPEAARVVVLAEKPAILAETELAGPIDDFIRQIGTLSSVYHQVPTKGRF